MKKFVTVVFLILLSINFVFGGSESATGSMGGIYYIGAPGTAPGGANPEFASLKAV